MSTISTRCFNPIRAEDYENKTFVQKLCFQRDKSVLEENCLSKKKESEFWDLKQNNKILPAGVECIDRRGRDYGKCRGHYNPRYFMMEAGCGADEIPSVDMDGVKRMQEMRRGD